MKGQNNFWLQNAFLTCSWRFLRSNKLEQLEFKLEKNIGIAEKVRNYMIDLPLYTNNGLPVRFQPNIQAEMQAVTKSRQHSLYTFLSP